MNNKFVMYADDLLSKWGFGDGDRLSDFLYENNAEYACKVGNHKLLEELVKRFLLPKLDKKVEIFFIQSIHNPVRVEMINGEYYTNHYKSDDNGLLGDVSVELTIEEIMAVIRDMEPSNE